MTPANSEPNAIFTGGVCNGNRGRGGWAAVFQEKGKRRIVSGNDRSTTSNRMELTAAIQGLLASAEHREVIVYSDSEYLINTINRGWERNSNLDLWEQLDQIRKSRQITWKWVSPHRHSPGNEIAGRVANMEAGLFQTREDKPSQGHPTSSKGKPRNRRGVGVKPGSNSQRPKRS